MDQKLRDIIKKLTDKLVDEGKIIEAGWVEMRHRCIAPDASEWQLKEMRMAFFAGAQHLFGSIITTLDPGEEETPQDMERMDNIANELAAFLADFKREHKITDFDPDDDARDIADAPPEVFAQIQELVRAGKVEFAPEALEKAKEKGLTEDEIIAMMMKSLNIKQH